MSVFIQIGLVVNKYKISTVVGEGSSGQVFTAISPNGEEVILKFIPLKNEWCKKEFEREVNSLGKCAECGLIVRLITSFTYKGHGVIVLEKLKGDLLDYLQLHQPLDVLLVKSIFYQICTAIQYIHKRSIAHLDIKPENIFMSSNSTIKLGDFGSSYQWQQDFEFKLGAVGTSYYCAPEVGPSQPYNPSKADIWSLGILLHVLLTGFWPFKGKNEKLLHDNVRSGCVHIFSDSLPRDNNLFDLLDNMLEKDPLKRFDITDVLSSSWLSTTRKFMDRTSRHGSSPTVISYEKREIISDRAPNSANSERRHATSGGGVFDFSDGEDSVAEEEEDSIEWDILPPKSHIPNIRLSEEVLGTSLPGQLHPEPMKKPRTFVNLPSEASPNSRTALATPIKDNGKKRSRTASFVSFINSKVKGRRSSAVDGVRRSRFSPT
mmetsp:Transcript_24251/g.41423  ORF Transcript_24251/g.41423 Transcript_24251/m.41423 type:complete len:433 (+) Transcript_24251:79-1377(+)